MAGEQKSGEQQAEKQNPNQANHNQQQNIYLSKGADVEVCSEDDGLEGAWFEANLLESLHFPLNLSSTEKTSLVSVQYKTLVTEADTSIPLCEPVSLSMLRPRPPSPIATDLSFGLYDVVDAFCNDGWWAGIINGLLCESRYSVLFLKPPDQIPFFSSELRIHMDWVDGNWIHTRKKGIEDLIFCVGSSVEVNLNDEGFNDAWFPANVLQVPENDQFVIRCHSPTKEDVSKHLIKTIDIHHIRPHPPQSSSKSFSLLGKVDAFFDGAWRSGVVTRVLPNNKYLVFCKHPNIVMEFINSDLRFHLEWKDRKWFNSSQDIVWTGVPEQENCGNNSGSGRKNIAGSKKSTAVGGSDIQKISRNVTVKKIELAKDSNGKAFSPYTSSRKKLKPNNSNESSAPLFDTLNKKENAKNLPSSHDMWNINVPIEGTPQKQTHVMEKQPSGTKLDNTSTDSFKMEMKKQTTSKEGDKSKLQVGSVPADFDSDNEKLGSSDPSKIAQKLAGTSIKESCNGSSTKTAELLQNENTNARRKMRRKRGRPHKLLSYSPKPLEADYAVETESAVKSSGEGNEGSGTVEVPMQNTSETPIKDGNSSIIRKSPVWGTVEAMEAFQLLPQNPHFTPLKKFREEFQEGMAIGSMITFAGLIDTISKLHWDDSRSCFSKTLEALSELEEHGFNIETALVRLKSLMALKEKSEKLVLMCREGEAELDKCYRRKTEMDAEVEEMEQKMKELEKKQAAALTARDVLNSEISSRRIHVNETTEEVNQTRIQFEKLGQVPLSSS